MFKALVEPSSSVTTFSTQTPHIPSTFKRLRVSINHVRRPRLTATADNRGTHLSYKAEPRQSDGTPEVGRGATR